MANLHIGDEAIPFTLPGVDGGEHSLAELAEGKKATAVIFICNHCPYVLGWMDRLKSAARNYAGQGVAFAGINANDARKYPADSFENMVELAGEWDLPFPYLWDESQEVAAAYGAERTPEIFLFDGNMRLRYHGAPDDNRDETQVSQTYLRDALDAVLGGREPAVPDTEPVGCTIKWK
jgi:peroxiredoxin